MSKSTPQIAPDEQAKKRPFGLDLEVARRAIDIWARALGHECPEGLHAKLIGIFGPNFSHDDLVERFRPRHKMNVDDPYGIELTPEVRDGYQVGVLEYFYEEDIIPILQKSELDPVLGQNLHRLLASSLEGEPSTTISQRVQSAYESFGGW